MSGRDSIGDRHPPILQYPRLKIRTIFSIYLSAGSPAPAWLASLRGPTTHSAPLPDDNEVGPDRAFGRRQIGRLFATRKRRARYRRQERSGAVTLVAPEGKSGRRRSDRRRHRFGYGSARPEAEMILAGRSASPN
jgi:hypothetical protein